MAKLSTRRIAGVAVAAGALLLAAPAAALADGGGAHGEASYVGPKGVASHDKTAVVNEDGDVVWHAEGSHVGPQGIFHGEGTAWQD